MPPDDPLDVLLDAWQSAYAAGRDTPPAELCHDRPDLLPEVERRVAVLRQAGRLAADPTGPLIETGAAATGTAPVPQTLGGFRVVGPIGAGGMGAVYRAEDPALGRPVALKVMQPVLAARPHARARFLREARAAAAVRDDHVCPIYHVGEDAGTPFLVMPLLDGESLAARLARGGALPPDEVARVGREAALGLAAAHAAGVVHRDVKPANLWLEAPNDRVLVLDFGLARAGGPADGLTSAGSVLGTAAYMAPEQADGQEVDDRADLFSLGAVLYEAATGRRAFEGVADFFRSHAGPDGGQGSDRHPAGRPEDPPMTSAPRRTSAGRLAVEALEDRATPAYAGTDPAFGTDGLAALPAGFTPTVAQSLSDGSVLLAGTVTRSGPTGTDLGLVKLSKSGAVDTTFGTGGLTALDAGLTGLNGKAGDESLTGLVVRPDGTIVVSAVSDTQVAYLNATGTASTPAVFRVTAGGGPDATYNGSGRAVLTAFQARPEGFPVPSVGLAADGGAVVVRSQTGSGQGFVVAARLTPDGAPDAAFGTGGTAKVQVPGDEGFLGINGAVIDAAGRVLFGASTGANFGKPGEVSRAQVGRLTAAGALDAGFGAGGLVTVGPTGGLTGRVRATLQGVQPDGGVIAHFLANQGVTQTDYRVTAAGTVDAAFGYGGALANTNFTNVTVRPDGQLWARGGDSADIPQVLLTADGRPADPTAVGVGAGEQFVLPGAAATFVPDRAADAQYIVLTSGQVARFLRPTGGSGGGQGPAGPQGPVGATGATGPPR
ncbi:MAG: protein kinase, partial [Gemmataceae bacterium]|nr:protein kinase [Gemmataceae bacterium]